MVTQQRHSAAEDTMPEQPNAAPAAVPCTLTICTSVADDKSAGQDGTHGATVDVSMKDGALVIFADADAKDAPWSSVVVAAPDVDAFVRRVDKLIDQAGMTVEPDSAIDGFVNDVVEAHALLVHLANGGKLDDMAPMARLMSTQLIERLGGHIVTMGIGR